MIIIDSGIVVETYKNYNMIHHVITAIIMIDVFLSCRLPVFTFD